MCFGNENEMKNFTTLIVDMVKKEKLFASQGGNIILAQVENEYGNVMDPYGDDGKSYINWCAQMADSLDIGVPWIMCQQAAAPKPMVFWRHLMVGIVMNTNQKTLIPLKCGLKIGLDDPLRTPEDLAYSVARFFQKGGTLQNYYMYHGGTNFGRTSGGPYITTTYDYNAPLDEYDANVNFGGINYFVPAWSISILPDCREEAYNTAKVSTQTSLMIKKLNKVEGEPSSLKWTWRPELIESASVQGRGDVSLNKIVDQKDMANDASDYLWYMTIDVAKNDPMLNGTVTLRVNDTGHNYGPMFDLVGAGITSPIELVLNKNVVKDLSSNKWTYKVGLNGISNKFFDIDCASKSSSKWVSDPIPIYRNFTWYKTTFKAPLENKPVVVDLLGLGKGMAWVNGHNLGRYWPSYIADKQLCKTKTCDYRGRYSNSKCVSKCGEPTQRCPQGVCGSFDKSEYDSKVDALSILEKECVGKESCSFKITEDKFGTPSCEVKKLAVEAVSRHQGSFPDNIKVGDLSSFTMDLKIQKAKHIPLDSVLARRQIDLLTAQAWFSENKQLEEKVGVIRHTSHGPPPNFAKPTYLQPIRSYNRPNKGGTK
ncbi:hypothetical protein GOBAR_DD32796 [Gossypium barbadense]|nr:hypothetical protein GOBAR_DD32796 [Gossypium barbadense]